MHHLRLLLTTVAVSVCFAACSADVASDGPSSSCDTSADCREGNTDLGGLCDDGDCVECASAADCVADSVYGDNATCIEGRCTVCGPGEVGCACLDDSYCLEGEGCRDGLCRPCDPGDGLCPCTDDASCSGDLVCQAQRCVDADCTDGAEGCVCGADDACADGLTCGDGVCRACPSDVAGCPCADDGSCGESLVCDNDSVACRAATDCAELSCGAARLCAVSGAVAVCLDECATGFQFDAATKTCSAIPGANCDAGAQNSVRASCDAQHRACVETGDTAACGACDVDGGDCFVGPADPAVGTCRAPTTCTTCTDANRACVEPAGCADVSCGDCVAGTFEYAGVCEAIQHVDCAQCDAANRDCLDDDGSSFCGHCAANWSEDPDGTCVAVENCLEGAENSILDRCIDLARECVNATADEPAHCGDCPAGTFVDPNTQVCVDLGACFSRDDCNEAAGFFCTQLGNQDQPQCRPAACAEGETWNRFAQRCESCAITCGDDAAAGSIGIWPASDRNGNCLCATSPGFFWDASASSGEAIECDKDQDTWLNEKIFEVFRTSKRSNGALRDDWSLILSVNCEVPEIDTIVMHNEWGQNKSFDVVSDLGAPGPVILYETARNDRAGVTHLENQAEVLDVQPDVINSLTKVCGDVLDDYNDNNVTDFGESQLDATPARPWQGFFNQLTYFMELHTGTYNRNARSFTIAERERDSADFPFHYFEGDDVNADHWRCCTRRRDKNYASNRRTGYDFASYECDASNGTCQFTWPEEWTRTGTFFPTAPPAVASPPVGGIPAYDSCDDGAAPGSVWRGMTHYSQFHCAKIVNVASPTPIAVSEVRLSDVYSGALTATSPEYVDSQKPWQLQRCSTTTTGVTTCSAQSSAGSVAASANSVAWLLRRSDNSYPFVPGGVDGYTGGCIDEWNEMPELCPGLVDNRVPGAIEGAGDNLDFGEISCGCGEGYGGTDCERGCAVPGIHVQSNYTPSNRQGFWSCTEPAVAGFGTGSGPVFTGTVAGETWSIDATVPLGNSVGAPLTQGEFAVH